jgi:MFS transporter, putative metabolite:H+ symporter
MTSEKGTFGTQPSGARAAQGAALLSRMERVPLTRFHLRIALILGLGTFFDSFDTLAIAVAMTAILGTFGAGVETAGFLIAAGYLGQIVGAIGFGFVSERFGRKAAFIASSLLFGLLSLVAAFAWSMASLLVLRLIQGLGLGAEVPVATAMFNEFVRARARGKIVLIYESLFIWGILVASLTGGLLLAVFPPQDAWRYLFAIGAVPALTAIWAFFRLPESPRHLVHQGDLATASAIVERMEASCRIGTREWADEDPAVPVAAVAGPPTQFGELFAQNYLRRTAMLWCTWFTTFFVLLGLTTFLPTLLVRAGVTPSNASLLSAAVTVGDIVVVYLAAATLDHLGRRFWFTAGYVLALIGAASGVIAIGLAGMSGWVVLFVAGTILLIGVNINAPLILMYTAELYPTRMRAWATMVGSTVRGLSAVIAPIALGQLVARAGGIGWMFALFAAVLAVGLVVFARYGIETKQRTLEELAR